MLWLLHAIFHFLYIIVLQKTYDSYLMAENMLAFWSSLLCFGGIFLIDQLCMTIANVSCENGSYFIMQGLGNALQKVVSREAAIEFEKSEYQDALKRAKDGIENATFYLNVVQTICCFQIPYLIFVTYYLLEHSWLLLCAFALICIPVGMSRIQRKKIYDKMYTSITPLEREIDIYNEAISGSDMIHESRFWGVDCWMEMLIEKALAREFQLKKNTANKAMLYGITFYGISMIGVITAIVIMISVFKEGNMTIGALLAIITSATTVLDLLENLVGFYLGQLVEQSGNVNYLVEFLAKNQDQEINNNSNKDEKKTDIVVENMSFGYPGMVENVLKNISFSSKKEESIAIVGENGAGKSTLMKIIAGIYRPTSGQCNLYGKQLVSFVFQDFQKYILSLKDNICFGQEISDERFNNLLEQVGSEDLFQGKEKRYNTVLSKEFGGIDLSRGQWQRIAIARGLFRENDLLILDEPTSAIDPVEETELYNLFLKLSEGKKIFIVTHRLGLCRHIDRILVLKNGRLVEDGNHEQLMQKGGEYKRLYNSQAGLYGGD